MSISQSADTVPYWKPLSETLDDYACHKEVKSGGDVGLLPRLRMKIDRNQIKYVGKEVANLDASNVLGVSEDSESCPIYENLEEKILEIRPRDSHKFGISRSNLIVIQKRIRNNDSQVKLQKGTIKKLQKAFSDVVSGNFRNENRKDSDSMIEQEVIMK